MVKLNSKTKKKHYKMIGFGNDFFFASMIKEFAKQNISIVAIFSLVPNLKPDNSINLEKVAKKLGSNFFQVKNINSNDVIKKIDKINPDFIFSSWPKIIEKKIIKIPKFGVLASHPTHLPFNRGRHPIQWQIVSGLKTSSLSFYMMDAGIDTGDIIMRLPYEIKPSETIENINIKIANLGVNSAKKLITLILKNKTSKQKQIDSNYLRKRDTHDVLIDFRLTASYIDKLVKSFSTPYPCAYFIFRNNIFRIHKSKVLRAEKNLRSINEPGKIFKVLKNSIIVYTSDKKIQLYSKKNFHSLKKIKYIHPPSKYFLENKYFQQLTK